MLAILSAAGGGWNVPRGIRIEGRIGAGGGGEFGRIGGANYNTVLCHFPFRQRMKSKRAWMAKVNGMVAQRTIGERVIDVTSTTSGSCIKMEAAK